MLCRLVVCSCIANYKITNTHLVDQTETLWAEQNAKTGHDTKGVAESEFTISGWLVSRPRVAVKFFLDIM